jgi:hypothetical protein
MYENFLAYRRYFWGKLTLATTLVLVISYIIYSRRVSPNGATLVGLIYGIISFLAILLLMYYGMRKRSYTAKHWSLQAWLSFHVYRDDDAAPGAPAYGFKFGLISYACLCLISHGRGGRYPWAGHLSFTPELRAIGGRLTYPMRRALMRSRKIIRQCAPCH